VSAALLKVEIGVRFEQDTPRHGVFELRAESAVSKRRFNENAVLRQRGRELGRKPASIGIRWAHLQIARLRQSGLPVTSRLIVTDPFLSSFTRFARPSSGPLTLHG
jgi:hypothetical protein